MNDIGKLELKNLSIDDFRELEDVMHESYSNWPGDNWEEKHIKKLLNLFPEGQLTIVVDGNVVGVALSIIVRYELYGDSHTYSSVRNLKDRRKDLYELKQVK